VIYDFEILDLDNILTESKLGKLVLFSYDVICCIHVLLLIIDHTKTRRISAGKDGQSWRMICLSAFSLFAMFIIIRELYNLYMAMVWMRNNFFKY
jgi:hypothetical protein